MELTHIGLRNIRKPYIPSKKEIQFACDADLNQKLPHNTFRDLTLEQVDKIENKE